jgi:hypothetical protein
MRYLILKNLVSLYPAGFRARYETDMLFFVQDELEEAAALSFASKAEHFIKLFIDTGIGIMKERLTKSEKISTGEATNKTLNVLRYVTLLCTSGLVFHIFFNINLLALGSLSAWNKPEYFASHYRLFLFIHVGFSLLVSACVYTFCTPKKTRKETALTLGGGLGLQMLMALTVLEQGGVDANAVNRVWFLENLQLIVAGILLLFGLVSIVSRVKSKATYLVIGSALLLIGLHYVVPKQSITQDLSGVLGLFSLSFVLGLLLKFKPKTSLVFFAFLAAVIVASVNVSHVVLQRESCTGRETTYYRDRLRQETDPVERDRRRPFDEQQNARAEAYLMNVCGIEVSKDGRY